ncbi:hypothetical protein CFOL_v3_15622 [Cephalotus follicularis]|uniref:CCHC-type domain-containing protein n=1 Tax=Cephalotus follicularis TaxID=3775 RepID=A0A1Q3BWG4_CEPFO|nr:hypothetical protein CFOL_v3_15622 [Cephalotus follicularis]
MCGESYHRIDTYFLGRGRGHGRGRGKGRGNERNQNFLGPRNNNSMKWQNSDTKQRQKWRNLGQSSNAGQAQNKKGDCNRCGMKGHWYRACRTAKHLVDLYQTSLKEKDKQIETNFIGHCDPLETTQSNFVSMGTTHLDIADFLTNPNGKMDQVIVDEDFHLG